MKKQTVSKKAVIKRIPQHKFSLEKYDAGIIEHHFPESQKYRDPEDPWGSFIHYDPNHWFNRKLYTDDGKIRKSAVKIYRKYAIGWTDEPCMYKQDSLAVMWEMPDGVQFWQHMSYPRFNLLFVYEV